MSFYKINPGIVDWTSKESYVFFNKKLKKPDFISFIPLLPQLSNHIWLSTSGRTEEKWVALSKEALLLSAQSVNQHLKASSKDRWGLVLPLFHVGGLSILARSYLTKSAYFSYSKDQAAEWSATNYVAFLKEHKITLSSLVPTQVYDLVKEGREGKGLSCPNSLRAIVVGGGHLSASLYNKARDLNWPLLPSYGLTECASQVATAELSSLELSSLKLSSLKKVFKESHPPLKILPHVQISIEGREIVIKSPALLRGFIPLREDLKVEFQDPKTSKGYHTGDEGVLNKDFLQITGTDSLKIMGEKVNFVQLEEHLLQILLKVPKLKGRYILLPVPMEREGSQISLISDYFDPETLSHILKEFNQKVRAPFEKIRQFYLLPSLPLTGISKISKKELFKRLGF